MTARTPRPGWVHVSDAHLGIWEQGDEARTFEGTRWLYREMLDFLRSRGWSFRQDAKAARCLRAGRHFGRKGDLQARSDRGGRAIQLDFFQTVTRADNPNGAVYDFNRYGKMPPAVRLRYLVEVAALLEWVARRRGYWLGHEYDPPTSRADETRPLAFVVRAAQGHASPADGPLAYFNQGWTPQRFTRGPDGWPLPEQCSSYGRPCVDRDKAPLTPGCVKYYRNYDGRLWRGRVYPNMNDMWFMVAGDLIAFAHASHFHEYRGEPPRRTHAGRAKKLKGELHKAVTDMNFERAIVLRNLLRDEAVAADAKVHAHAG